MTTKLSTSNYTALNSGITELMRTGTFSGVSITVYSDASGTTVVNDNTGTQVHHLKITSVNTTNEYIDSNGATINATLIIGFSNNSNLTAVDNVNDYWYKIEGIVLIKRTF